MKTTKKLHNNKKNIKIINIINKPVVEDPVILRNKLKQDIIKELQEQLKSQSIIPLSKLQEHTDALTEIKQLQELNLKDIWFLKAEVSKNSSAIVKMTEVFNKTKSELETKMASTKIKQIPVVQPAPKYEGIIAKILKLLPKPLKQTKTILLKPQVINNVIQKTITITKYHIDPKYDEKLSILSNRIILINNWIKHQEKLNSDDKREFGKLRRQVRANTTSTTTLGLMMMGISATIAGITSTLAVATSAIDSLKASFTSIKKGAKGAIKSVASFAKRIPLVGAAIESTDALFEDDIRKRLKLAPTEKITAKHRAEVALKSGISGAIGVVGDTAGLIAKGIGWATGSKTATDFGNTLENSIGSEGMKSIIYKVTESAKAEVKKDIPQDYKTPEKLPETNKPVINNITSEVPTEIQMPDFNLINIDNSEVIREVQQDNPTLDFTATPTYLEQELFKLHV